MPFAFTAKTSTKDFRRNNMAAIQKNTLLLFIQKGVFYKKASIFN